MLLPSLLLGCAVQPRIVEQSLDAGQHAHGDTEIRSFGNQHFHAQVKYDAQAGYLAIQFLDKNENPVKLVKAKKVKASMTLPEGKSREFYLDNPNRRTYPPGSRQAARVKRYANISSDNVQTQRDWLEDLSSFNLKVWIPIGGTTYVMDFDYAGNNST